MFFKIITINFLLANLILLANGQIYTLEDSLEEYSDSQIEDELRRRWLGGPWSVEEASSILNSMIDLLFDKNQASRPRRFQVVARHILELLTGDPDSHIVEDSPETSTIDSEYYDDQIDLGSGHHVSIKTMRTILDMYEGTNGQKKRSTDSIEKLYPWFRTSHIFRFRQRLESNGTRFEKLKSVDNKVLTLFTQARKAHAPVHGRTIQRWARQSANAFNITDLLASDSWLKRFKRRHGIVSRKVTIYKSRADLANQATVAELIGNFTEQYRRESAQFDRSSIWNYDQTGLNYEPANFRALSFKGERDTIIKLDSHNKHSHSYTVQPMISRGGRLFPRL